MSPRSMKKLPTILEDKQWLEEEYKKLRTKPETRKESIEVPIEAFEEMISANSLSIF